jgi:ribonuclease HII
VIAAASVVAKVTRDRYMKAADARYPGFGFAENVGYSTPEHREAIMRDGPSGLHRRSFASIAYSQLSLDGRPLEGVPDVVAADHAALLVDPDAGDVEAQARETG